VLQPAINVLLSIIKSTEAAAAGDNSANRKKRGGNTQDVLQRPIICICNDLYVPALRQLRQCAFLVTFHGTAAASLASRLMEVSF
jgi:chromosome transmission fidelity protein 18